MRSLFYAVLLLAGLTLWKAFEPTGPSWVWREAAAGRDFLDHGSWNDGVSPRQAWLSQWMRGLADRYHVLGVFELATHGLGCVFFWLAIYRRSQSIWRTNFFITLFVAGTALVAPLDSLAMLFMGFMLWLIASGRKAGLPILFLVWANTGAMPLAGLGFLSVWFIGRWFERAPDRWTGIAMAVFCSLVVLINPGMWRIYTETILAGSMPSIKSFEGWKPMSYSEPSLQTWIHMGSLLFAIFVQIIRINAFTTSTMLLLFAFGLWPTVFERGLAWWILVFPWLLALPSLPPRKPTRKIPAGLLVAAATLPAIAAIWSPLPNSQQKLLKHLPRDYLYGPTICDPTTGDELAVWIYRQTAENLLHTRPISFTREQVEDAFDVVLGKPGYWDVLDRYEVTLIVVKRTAKFPLPELIAKNPKWKIVLNEDYLIAIKQEPR